MDFVHAACGVHHADAPRIRLREIQVSLPHAPMELQGLLFEAILVAGGGPLASLGAGEGRRRLEIEKQRQVRIQGQEIESIQLLHEILWEVTSPPLVGARGVLVTIAKHQLFLRQGGENDPGQVLSPRGLVEQELGERTEIPVGGIEEESPNLVPHFRAARLACENVLNAATVKANREELYLCGL